MKDTIIIEGVKAKFTKVDKPDTTYNPDGEYIAVVALDKDTHTKLMKSLDPIIDKTVTELKAKGEKVTKGTLNVPLKSDPDGTTILKTKAKAKGKNRETGQEFENKVTVLDSEGHTYSTIPMIGQGSILNLTVDIVPYSVSKRSGLSFRLRELQVADLVEVELKSTEGPTLAKAPF